MINPITAYSNLQQFRADALGFFARQGVYEDGVAEIEFGLRRALVIADPEVATAVLLSDRFDKGREAYGPLGTFAGFGALRWLVGPTLPVLDGAPGLRRRRLLMPVYARIMQRFADPALPRITFPDLPPQERDIYPLISQAVFERFCGVMFGRPWSERAGPVGEAVSLATTTLDILSKSYLPHAGSWGPAGSAIARCRATILAFAREVHDDLVGSDVDAAIRPLFGSGLSQEEICDEILTQIVAGTETTSITSCWALSLLVRHPEALAELREGRLAVDAVVQETLRMYPAFWTLIRVTRGAEEVAGRRVPAGTVLFVSPFCIHHNPAVWDAPEVFRPGRFADRQGTRGDFMPYGYGARACLGGRLAHGIITECVAQAARQLELAPCPAQPQIIDPLIVVLKSKTGFRFQIASRDHRTSSTRTDG